VRYESSFDVKLSEKKYPPSSEIDWMRRENSAAGSRSCAAAMAVVAMKRNSSQHLLRWKEGISDTLGFVPIIKPNLQDAKALSLEDLGKDPSRK
jgi:hypothetical protein